MEYEPPPDLPELNFLADERTTLVEMLDYYRMTLLHRSWILDQTQLATRLKGHPSDLTIGGLMLHMALVEDIWFTRRLKGLDEPEPWASAPFDDDPDWEMHIAASWTPAQIRAQFLESVARSEQITTATESLDEITVLGHPVRGEHWNLRWILVHMIEEYARHCGHADLLREAIDGVTEDWRPRTRD
jgi:uncharacterized damage-inducible protein DinB